MAQEEGKMIAQVDVEESSQATEQAKPKLASLYVEEWVYFLLGSSHAQNMNTHIFKDAYSFYRDSIVFDTNENELFYYFYNNRFEKSPICNPQIINMAKFIILEVIVDIDLMKALIKSQNPTTKGFHRKGMNILCRLDRETFIEAFDLGGPMIRPIEKEKMNETFKSQKSFLTGRVMRRHIPKEKKEKGELPKKVGELMPLNFFYKYFKYTIFGINKLVGVDDIMNAPGYIYIMTLDIQDPVNNAGYDFVEYIINKMHEEIVVIQKGELENFRFFH